MVSLLFYVPQSAAQQGATCPQKENQRYRRSVPYGSHAKPAKYRNGNCSQKAYHTYYNGKDKDEQHRLYQANQTANDIQITSFHADIPL
jgi:hypothetical protein